MTQTANNMDGLIYQDADSLLRFTLAGGEARVFMCRVTRAAQQAADIHGASDVAAAAMGRLLAMGGLMTGSLEEEEESLTLMVSGDGPSGRMTLVARPEKLKITVDQPQIDLPLRADGKQDVSGYLGKAGKLTVIRDSGRGEPHIGISNLVSGELGQDFAEYFAMSEQTATLVALGCLNQQGKVLSAGGILIQALPGCSEQVISQLELREPFFRGISREIYDRSLVQLAQGWFDGLEPQGMLEVPLHLQCDCSRERMERALIALGEAELRQIAQSQEDTQMVCHFCRSQHSFSPERIAELLAQATIKGSDHGAD